MSRSEVAEAESMERGPTCDFDLQALESFLRKTLNEGRAGGFRFDPVAGGQSNPTFFVTFGRCRMVLRKKPADETLPSAHVVDREFRVISALAGTAVPAPRALFFSDDLSIVGTPFYLMERLEGRVFQESSLPRVSPANRELGAHAIRNLLTRTGAQLLKREKGRYALATQCIGGGMGIIMILEAA